MKRSLPVGLWTFIILCGCVGSQVAQEVQLGRNALQTGQPQVAVGYLQNAAELDPNYKTPYSIRESVWTYLGRAYYEVGNLPEARRALEKALSDDKDDPLARLYLGLTLLRAGDQQEGRRETEAGLRGVNNLLNRLASSPSNGIYWDPTRLGKSALIFSGHLVRPAPSNPPSSSPWESGSAANLTRKSTPFGGSRHATNTTGVGTCDHE